MTTGVREGEIRADRVSQADRQQARRIGLQVLALFALVVVIGWLWPSQRIPPESGRHTSFGASAAEFRALYTTLTELGFAVDRQRGTYGRLPPAERTVLLTLDPMSPERLSNAAGSGWSHGVVAELATWVRDGGTWLATWPGATALNVAEQNLGFLEPEDWQPSTDEGDPFSIAAPLPTVARGNAIAPIHGHGRAAAIVARFADVFDVARLLPAEFEPEDRAISVRVFGTPLADGWQPLLSLGDRPFAIERSVGAGRIVLVSTPLPFTNAGLGLLGCGPLATALIHATTDDGRRGVWFDEYCHGLPLSRGMWWWARHTHFFEPVLAGLLVVIALAWRGAIRATPTMDPPRAVRRSGEEFVVAIGGILARAGRRGAATRRILDGHVQLAHARNDSAALRRLDTLRPRDGHEPDAGEFASIGALAHAAVFRADPESDHDPIRNQGSQG